MLIAALLSYVLELRNEALLNAHLLSDLTEI